MSNEFKMKQAVFNAQDLYKMLRLSMIDYFPYDTSTIQTAEILSFFLQKQHGLEFEIANVPAERGLTFSGDSYGVRLENGKYPTLSLFFVQTAVY